MMMIACVTDLYYGSIQCVLRAGVGGQRRKLDPYMHDWVDLHKSTISVVTPRVSICITLQSTNW